MAIGERFGQHRACISACRKNQQQTLPPRRINWASHSLCIYMDLVYGSVPSCQRLAYYNTMTSQGTSEPSELLSRVEVWRLSRSSEAKCTALRPLCFRMIAAESSATLRIEDYVTEGTRVEYKDADFVSPSTCLPVRA